MAEEVVIKVRQESQGNALAETEAKIKSLRAEAEKARTNAEASANKFGFNDVTARSARAEAASLEREANRLERPIRQQASTEEKAARKAERDATAATLREQRAAAKEAGEEKRKFAAEDKADAKAQIAEKQAAEKAAAAEVAARKKEEKEITSEVRRREAVMAARARMATNLAERAAGVSGMGGMNSMASGIGGTAGVAASVAVAVVSVAAAIAGAIQERFRSQRLIEMAGNTANVRQGQHLKRMGEAGGSDATSANAEEKAAHDEYMELSEHGKELKEKAKPRWYNWSEFGLWAWNKATGDDVQTLEGQEEDQKNDKAKERALKREAVAKELKKKKWAEEGAVELEGRKAELNHDMTGKRFADDKLAAVREYNRVVQALGGSTPKEKAEAAAIATDAATDLVRLRQREQAGHLAGLVNARTGTRGTAQIARVAAGFNSPGRAEDVVAAIHGLNNTVKAVAQPPLHNWMPSRRP